MSVSAADHLAISEVIARYCHATDAGDGAATAALFTSDGILEVSGAWQARGRAQIAEMGSLPGEPMRHLVNSIVVEGNGSTASSTASFAAIRRGGGLLGSGHLYSKLTKQKNGQWKLVHHLYKGDYEGADATAPQTQTSDADALSTSDRVAILELIYRHGQAVDSRDAEARADCYVDDAIYVYEGIDNRTVGREAMAQKLREASDPGDSLHWTTNHIIEGTSTDARGSPDGDLMIWR